MSIRPNRAGRPTQTRGTVWAVPPPAGPLGLPSSPAALRDEFERRIVLDLLGPADGPTERFFARGGATRVRDRYLVGMLAPKDTIAFDRGRDEDTGVETDESGEGDTTTPERPSGPASLFPSSMGLSVTLEPECELVEVRAEWGRYRKDSDADEDGKRIPAWQREPCSHRAEIELRPGDFEVALAPQSQPGVLLRGRAERLFGGWWLLAVFLVNEQVPPMTNKDQAWLFQTRLTLEHPAGRAVFLGRREALGAPAVPASDRDEVERFDMQYRNIVEYGIGHGNSVHATPSGADPRRAVRVETTSIPRFEVPRTDPPDPTDVPEFTGVELDMKALSEADEATLEAGVAPLADGYLAWLTTERRRITDPAARLNGFEMAAEGVLDEAEQVARDIRAGIDRLLSDPVALGAFRFANRVMWQQRVHSVAASQRNEAARHGRPPRLRASVSAADVARNRRWRPFQLAFLLLNVPSLSDPAHQERSRPGLIDLLYFPTGGGKTEAYLGLVAFVFAIRRLQGPLAADDGTVYDGTGGMAVFMRYTLRLLTAQQIQRAAALVCAAELERRRLAASDDRWAAGSPFRLGMWVGSKVTPNRMQDAAEAIAEAHDRGEARGSSPKQLVSCPWCGTKIDVRGLQRDPITDRSLLYCVDPTGECPFTEAGSPGEGIPLVTVDDDIYRLVPSFLISTVDKFAQLPWEGALAHLFGHVDRRCSRHGYRHPDLDPRIGCGADRHPARGNKPPASTQPVQPLRPPDLILQDELHLISGPLGTLVGLYETAVDHLTTWMLNGRPVRPKVVASTATVRRAAEQGNALFWRSLRVFPPPALDQGRQFFAEQAPLERTPGRLYLGVCARGVRLKQVQVRVFIAVMCAAQALWDRYGPVADPYLTTVGYFNALRELAGMRRMADDELSNLLRRWPRWSSPLARRVRLKVEELTSRVQSGDIPDALARLGVAFDPTDPDADPIDLLLATNMLSVGVDLPRLGSMIVVGQPKQTAEYIQATSRVGRDRDKPGLVVTLYNWARPRDVSHYETFEHYHATFYRRVEALSVTPFSARALDRGLTAVVVGEARHRRGGPNTNPSAQGFNRLGPVAAELLADITERGVEILADNNARSSLEAEIRRRFDEWTTEQSARSPYLTYQKRGPNSVPLLHKPGTGPWGRWTCPNSLRETEPSINLIVDPRDAAWGGAPAFRPMPPPPQPAPAATDGAPAPAGTTGTEAADTEDTDVDAVLADAGEGE